MLVSFKKEIGKSGFLTKQGIKFKSWKRRYFELDATTLNYFLSPHHTKPKGIIHLRNATVMPCNKRPLCFQIDSVARDGIGGRRFFLVAESQEECDQWMLAIQNSIDFIDNTAAAATKWKHTGSLQYCGPVRRMKNHSFWWALDDYNLFCFEDDTECKIRRRYPLEGTQVRPVTLAGTVGFSLHRGGKTVAINRCRDQKEVDLWVSTINRVKLEARANLTLHRLAAGDTHEPSSQSPSA